MNVLSLSGRSIRVIKDGDTVPYWFPLKETLVLPNSSHTGVFVRCNDVSLELKWEESGAPTAFTSLQDMIDQLNTWITG